MRQARRFAVFSQELMASQARRDAFEQTAMKLRPGLRQPVINPEPLLAADHQPVPPQVSQMPRDRGLRQLERFVQMADANLARSEQVQEPQPHRVGERFEKRYRGIQRVSRRVIHSHSRI